VRFARCLLWLNRIPCKYTEVSVRMGTASDVGAIILPAGAIGYDARRRIRMAIAEQLKTLRVRKNLSQGDIGKRAGLLCCYTCGCV
jgi:hypothetical protein